MLLFPQRCSVCGSRMPCGKVPICGLCTNLLDEPCEFDVRDVLATLDNDFSPVTATALWFYDADGPVRRLHRRFKFQGMLRLGVNAGFMLGERIAGSGLEERPDAIVPVPINRVRLRERGYNQSLLIAEGLAQRLSLPVEEDLVLRVDAATSQVGRDRRARIEALSSAFQCQKKSRQGPEHALIVDDVLTTGATILSVARRLREVGVVKISLAVVAIVRR